MEFVFMCVGIATLWFTCSMIEKSEDKRHQRKIDAAREFGVHDALTILNAKQR